MIDDREIGEQDECSGYISMRSVLELGNSHCDTFPRSEPRTCPGLAVRAVGRSDGSEQLIHSSRGR